MSRLWEFERKTLGGRREGFLRSAQISGFHKLARDSLISRGLDPDIMGGLSAPPSTTKPIDRDIIREVVPEPDVSNTQRALRTRPRSTFIPPEERAPEKRTLSGGLFKAIGEVAGQAVSDVLSILDVVDIPRREVGKPVARVILEPLAMTADILNALSPANVPGIPSIRGVTRPPLTGGEIRGGTSVEILSYITDPLNAVFFAVPAIKAAKAATLGARLGLKDAQALRKVTPLARRLMVEESGGRVTRITKAGEEVVERVPIGGRALPGPEAAQRLRGKDLPGTRALTLEEATPKLTKSVPVHESQGIKDFRVKLSGNGRKPPPPPPPRLPGEPGGLLPGDQAPSMSLWRTIESGLFLSPRSNDLMRRTAEMVGDAPGIKLFMKAITGPAALARVLPEIRAGVVYRRLQGVMEAQLGQRLVGSEEAFYSAFKVGKDTSKVIVGGKEVAFGDFASDVLMGARIGAPRARYPVTAAQREWIVTQKSLIDDIARQYEHVSGEELRLLGDDYWPRFVIGDDGRVTVKGRVGAKQSPVKERKLGEMEDAIARGTPYASPTQTVQLYGRAMQKMTRDKMLIQVIKEDGIGRPVMKQLTGEIKALKAQIKGINTNTVDGLNEAATLRNKIHNLQAVRASKKRALIPAKQVLGPGFGKQMLEPESAKVMQDIIGPGLGGKVGKGLRGAT